MKTTCTVTNSCIYVLFENARDNWNDLDDALYYLAETGAEITGQWSEDGNDYTAWVWLTCENLDIAAICKYLEGE